MALYMLLEELNSLEETTHTNTDRAISAALPAYVPKTTFLDLEHEFHHLRTLVDSYSHDLIVTTHRVYESYQSVPYTERGIAPDSPQHHCHGPFGPSYLGLQEIFSTDL